MQRTAGLLHSAPAARIKGPMEPGWRPIAYLGIKFSLIGLLGAKGTGIPAGMLLPPQVPHRKSQAELSIDPKAARPHTQKDSVEGMRVNAGVWMRCRWLSVAPGVSPSHLTRHAAVPRPGHGTPSTRPQAPDWQLTGFASTSAALDWDNAGQMGTSEAAVC